MSIFEARLPSLRDKYKELSNEELKAEVKKLEDDIEEDIKDKVEKPKAKKKK